VTFILKFGNNLSGKFQQRLGTETTSHDLKRPSQLNGGDSRVYLVTVGNILKVLTLTEWYTGYFE